MKLLTARSPFRCVHRFARLARLICKALIAGGDLIFTIDHPIFIVAANPQWSIHGEGRKSWLVNRYFFEGERRSSVRQGRFEVP